MVIFRRAAVADVSGIYDVMVTTHYITAFYDGKPLAAIRNELIAKLFAADTYVFVACEGEQVIGYSIFAPYAKYYQEKKMPAEVEFAGKKYDLRGYAYSLGTGVLASLQGKGIGPMLREFADNEIKKEGFQGIVTDVNPENKPSVKNQLRVGMIRVADLPCARSKTRPRGINTLWMKPF